MLSKLRRHFCRAGTDTKMQRSKLRCSCLPYRLSKSPWQNAAGKNEPGELMNMYNLYWNQLSTIRVDWELTKAIKIRRVGQRCIISNCVYRILTTNISRSIRDSEGGISMNRKRLNKIRYAKDNIVLTHSVEGFQTLVNRIPNHKERIRNTKTE